MLPVPKKRSPFAPVVCDSTKGSVNEATFRMVGPARRSPRDVTAKPSMSPARKSSTFRTRQNCGATAKAEVVRISVTASANSLRIRPQYRRLHARSDCWLDVEFDLERAVDDVAERVRLMIEGVVLHRGLRRVGSVVAH